MSSNSSGSLFESIRVAWIYFAYLNSIWMSQYRLRPPMVDDRLRQHAHRSHASDIPSPKQKNLHIHTSHTYINHNVLQAIYYKSHTYSSHQTLFEKTMDEARTHMPIRQSVLCVCGIGA